MLRQTSTQPALSLNQFDGASHLQAPSAVMHILNRLIQIWLRMHPTNDRADNASCETSDGNVWQQYKTVFFPKAGRFKRRI